MKKFKNFYVIGIDHGYGNMKTANCYFPTGVMTSESEPTFVNDLLVWNGKYYSIGVGHKEFKAGKFHDEDYYVLTLAAIAREFSRERITEASVWIAAGLPLTWVSEQKTAFQKYLLQHREVSFTFQNMDYKIKIIGTEIYPQGFAAIAERLGAFHGVNMLCDIGNGTMNVLYLIDGRPQTGRMYTEKFGIGTYQCTLAVREVFMQKTRREINDAIIEEVLITGTANIAPADLKIIRSVATEYVNDIFRRLREHGYDENTMTLYITGGGGCLVKNFCKVNTKRVKFVEDICAAAKGYEYMAELQLKSGAAV